MSRRRGQVRGTRSTGNPPWEGKISYYCTGGAGDAGKAWPAPEGLTWLPGGGHVPVTNLERVTGGRALSLRCPLCGLSRPVGYKRRELIAAAGLTEVDISALPF